MKDPPIEIHNKILPLSLEIPNRRHRFGEVDFVPDVLSRIPETAAMIARVIATWSRFEYNSVLVASELLGGSESPAFKVFGTINGDVTRRKVLEIVDNLNSNLHNEEKIRYLEIRDASKVTEIHRHRLAHGLFALPSKACATPIFIVYYKTEIVAQNVEHFYGDFPNNNLKGWLYSLENLCTIMVHIEKMNDALWKIYSDLRQKRLYRH